MSYRPPILYKKSSTGAIQEWSITTDENVIITSWGQRGGAVQTTTDIIKAGKNLGRKNETTPSQQAEAEALSRWEKQLKKGYVQSIDDAEAGKTDKLIEGGVAPMLAHRFDEQGHKIVFPALAQPKFDGHRCIAVVQDGKASLWSRTRKPITGVPHIIADIEALVKERGVKNVVFDGELYNHSYRDNFEELTGFIRQVEPKPGHEVVEYHIYDLAGGHNASAAFVAQITDLNQGARIGLLRRIFNDGDKFGALRRVETIEVTDEDEMMIAFEGFLTQGYEGLMVRNALGAYVNKRSYDLQKVKEFADAEFPVIGVEEGRGKLAGHAIFVCTTKDGTEFRVKMKGDTAQLKAYFDDPKAVIGRQLTVKYQGITNKSGVPRFPVGMRFREDV